MNVKTSDAEPKTFLLEVWEKHEKIAMHFNELILKLRIQALGAVAALVTIGGVLLKTVPSESQLPWPLLACVFAALLLFWIAIWVLDFAYYNRLLIGAVESLLPLEDAINSGEKVEFNMSHKIRDAVRGESPNNGPYRGPLAFYLIVAAVLFAGMAYSFGKWIHL